MLCPLSYAPKDGGTRTRDPKDPRRNPHLRNRPISLQRQRVWLRGHGSNAELLVQSQA